MIGPDYSKRDYLLPKGCKDLADTLVITLPKQVTVVQLAALLGKKPVQLIADLYRLGVFASAEQAVNFETASEVAQKYGYRGRPA
jgi:hypothetical protein